MDKRCLPFVSLAVAAWLAAPAVLLAKPPSGPSTDALIARAKAAIADGTVVPSRDLAPLLERLAASRNQFEQQELIDDVETWGRDDGAYPAAVKAYLRDAAPPVLLAVARSKTDSLVRGDALMAIGSLGAADSFLDEAIAVAKADPDHMVQFKGSLLARGRERREHPVIVGGAPAAAAAPAAGTHPASPAKEQAALKFLRRRHERVSADTLGQAALHADTEVVVALLDAGVDVNAPTLMGTPLDFALGPGCVGDRPGSEARLATVDALIQHGADVKRQDAGGNTILMGAVECPVAVVARLVAAGASVDAKNAQGFSPLQNALMRGKWEIAEFLVDHGARLSKKQVGELFFELPSDAKKRALIQRATVQ